MIENKFFSERYGDFGCIRHLPVREMLKQAAKA